MGGSVTLNYHEYIRSDKWKQTRAHAIWVAAGRCQFCGPNTNGRPLEVHHNDYSRLGRERPEDLTVLCSLCHAWHEAKKFYEAELMERIAGVQYAHVSREACGEWCLATVRELKSRADALNEEIKTLEEAFGFDRSVFATCESRGLSSLPAVYRLKNPEECPWFGCGIEQDAYLRYASAIRVLRNRLNNLCGRRYWPESQPKFRQTLVAKWTEYSTIKELVA